MNNGKVIQWTIACQKKPYSHAQCFNMEMVMLWALFLVQTNTPTLMKMHGLLQRDMKLFEQKAQTWRLGDIPLTTAGFFSFLPKNFRYDNDLKVNCISLSSAVSNAHVIAAVNATTATALGQYIQKSPLLRA